MYQQQYSLTIPEGIEDSDGYVALKHKQAYKIRLDNSSDRRCDVDVYVDGKSIGTFRVNAYGSITLERPVNDDGRFTFFKTNSQEATKAGLNTVSKESRGLVQAVFKPERKPQYEVRPVIMPYLDHAIRSSDVDYGFTASNSNAKGMYDSGGTGLTGKSHQNYTDVHTLNYDNPSSFVTLSLRLVCKKKEVVRPLQSVSRVPKPVD